MKKRVRECDADPNESKITENSHIVKDTDHPQSRYQGYMVNRFVKPQNN